MHSLTFPGHFCSHRTSKEKEKWVSQAVGDLVEDKTQKDEMDRF